MSFETTPSRKQQIKQDLTCLVVLVDATSASLLDLVDATDYCYKKINRKHTQPNSLIENVTRSINDQGEIRERRGRND